MEGEKQGADASIPAGVRVSLGGSQLGAASTGSFSHVPKAEIFQGI